ncbi:MAG: DUF3667 domain-containing protein, partial [Bacteroidota bacterium]
CSQCGQPTSTGEISFKETINNFFTIAFALEGPLWLTIRLLITNPGKLYREYIGGKRKTYYKPVAFFILIAAIYLILRVWINFDPLEGVNNDLAELPINSEVVNRLMEVIRLMEGNINYQLILLVFSIGISLKLFFRKKYNLAEYTSIGLYITGVYALVRTIAMFFLKFGYVEVAYVKIDDFEFGALILFIFYSSFSLFQKKNLSSVVKYALVSFFSYFLYSIFIFATGLFIYIVSLK